MLGEPQLDGFSLTTSDSVGFSVRDLTFLFSGALGVRESRSPEGSGDDPSTFDQDATCRVQHSSPARPMSIAERPHRRDAWVASP